MKMTRIKDMTDFTPSAHPRSGAPGPVTRALTLARPSGFRVAFILPLMVGLLLIWQAGAFADIAGSAFSGILPPSRSELVIIDAGVDKADQLASRLKPDAEVYILRADRPAFAQITEILSGRNNLTALHLFSHGAAGRLNFANGRLTGESLHRRRGELKRWGDALGTDGDILLYGCGVAGGEVGVAFVKDLAELTGADVAASVDATGHKKFGADVELEFTAGMIETDAAVSSHVVFGPLQTFDFDWSSEGWSPAGPGSMPRTYTNVAGSGVDVEVSVQENSYSGGSGFFIDGTPNVNDDNGNLADEALNFKVNFPHRRDAVDITFTFSSPVYIYNGVTIRDIDRITNSPPYNYQDRILVWGRSGGSRVYPSHIALETPTNLAIGGANGNRVQSIAGGNLNPGDPRGHATFYFHIQTISSLTIRYRGGNGGGSQ
ncbi:MAG: DUF4347 domain-containing protein, partial [Desulfobacterales bacterium]|nr:DUF4347 domain-containing protein [Desulfobacterales bacterium]